MGFLLAVIFRMNLSDLIVVALPFHFRLDLGFPATLSLAYLVLPLALLEVVLQHRRGHRALTEKIEIRLLALWLGLLLIATAFAAVTNEIAWLTWSVSFSKITISVLFAVWVIARFSKTGSFLSLLKIWVWVSVGVAGIGFGSNLVADFFAYRSSFFYAESRLMATFENPNHFAFHMLVAAMFSLIISFLSHRPTYLAPALFLLFSAVESDSQAVHIALLVAAVIGMLSFGLDRRYRLQQATFSCLTIFFVFRKYISVSPGFSGPSAESAPQIAESAPQIALATSQFTGDLRWSIWADLIEIWSASPWFGIGLGQFPRVGQSGYQAHSTPLSLLVEVGVVLTLLTAAMFLTLLARGFLHNVWSRMMAVVALAGSVFGLGNNVENIATFWIVIGFIAVLSSNWRETKNRVSRAHSRPLGDTPSPPLV